MKMGSDQQQEHILQECHLLKVITCLNIGLFRDNLFLKLLYMLYLLKVVAQPQGWF